MTYSLWVPGKLPGQNEWIEAAKGHGGRGYGYSKLKRAWTDSIALLAKAAKLPKLTGPVRFRFEWREANRKRDPDNIAGGGRKAILDGLVTAGVIPGDGWAVVAGWGDEFLVSTPPGVLVTMSPYSNRSPFLS